MVGDDEAFLAEAEALAVERLGCKLFRGRAAYEMASHTQHVFNALPYDQRCAASLHLFTDLELMAHTDYFVGARRPARPGRRRGAAPRSGRERARGWRGARGKTKL
jgi:hypothetical protein